MSFAYKNIACGADQIDMTVKATGKEKHHFTMCEAETLSREIKKRKSVLFGEFDPGTTNKNKNRWTAKSRRSDQECKFRAKDLAEVEKK